MRSRPPLLLISAAAAFALTTIGVTACAAPQSPAGDAPAPSRSAIPYTPTPTNDPRVWTTPASWPEEVGGLADLTVRQTRFSQSVTGVVKSVDLTVAGSSEDAAKAWMTSLPDIPLTTHVESSRIRDDLVIHLTSGARTEMVPEGLPESWWTVLPLGPRAMDYLFAGVEFTVDGLGAATAPPTFQLILDDAARIDAYVQWLRDQPGWTVTEQEDYFTAESDSFAVRGHDFSRRDELTIQAKSWDLPGLEGLRPDMNATASTRRAS